MPKRSRSLSIEVKGVEDENVIIEWRGKEYYVCNGKQYTDLFTNSEMECDVIHNYENQAMLNIEDIRSGEILLRQEINPLKFKDSEKWVRDE